MSAFSAFNASSQTNLADLDLALLETTSFNNFLQSYSMSPSYVDAVIERTPLTLYLIKIEGVKETPGDDNYGEPELEVFSHIYPILVVGSPLESIGQKDLHLPDYLNIEWSKTKITETVFSLPATTVLAILDDAVVNVTVVDTHEEPFEYPFPDLIAVDEDVFPLSDSENEYTPEVQVLPVQIIEGYVRGPVTTIKAGLVSGNNDYRYYEGLYE